MILKQKIVIKIVLDFEKVALERITARLNLGKVGDIYAKKGI